MTTIVFLQVHERGGLIEAELPQNATHEHLHGVIAAAAGDMVVIAGTHVVDEVARASGVYEALACPKGQLPRAREAK